MALMNRRAYYLVYSARSDLELMSSFPMKNFDVISNQKKAMKYLEILHRSCLFFDFPISEVKGLSQLHTVGTVLPH